MVTINHICIKCKTSNKQNVSWLDPKKFTKKPEMPKVFWCTNQECQRPIAILVRFEKENNISIVKELPLEDMFISPNEEVAISARPKS